MLFLDVCFGCATVDLTEKVTLRYLKRAQNSKKSNQNAKIAVKSSDISPFSFSHGVNEHELSWLRQFSSSLNIYLRPRGLHVIPLCTICHNSLDQVYDSSLFLFFFTVTIYIAPLG